MPVPVQALLLRAMVCLYMYDQFVWMSKTTSERSVFSCTLVQLNGRRMSVIIAVCWEHSVLKLLHLSVYNIVDRITQKKIWQCLVSVSKWGDWYVEDVNKRSVYQRNIFLWTYPHSSSGSGGGWHFVDTWLKDELHVGCPRCTQTKRHVIKVTALLLWTLLRWSSIFSLRFYVKGGVYLLLSWNKCSLIKIMSLTL